MKTFRLKTTLAFGVAALTLIGCGGSGGDAGVDTGGGSSAPEVKLSGTAAVGLALAGSTVDVKCASGTATAVTNDTGGYTVTVTDGALPCIVKVTGTLNGVPVTLHSLAEAGTSSGSVTTAAANVTPLTEMILAQATGGLPSTLFDSFSSSTSVSSEQLTGATSTILAALRDATGIDVTAIDPFKATLVAATSSTPSAGNDYDKLLDQLGARLNVEALPLVVTQIASVAASGGSSSETLTLTEVMTAVDKGALPGCPAVFSGKYRSVDYFGRSSVAQIDFKNMKYNRGNGDPLLDITVDSSKPCEFVAAGIHPDTGEELRISYAMGPSGGGAYRKENLTLERSTTGHIFPVQGHELSTLAGDWTFVWTGAYEGVLEQLVSKLSVSSSGIANVCDYESIENPVCVPAEQGLELKARADGGFDLMETIEGTPTAVAQIYAFRAPNGVVSIFGTTNAAGNNEAIDQTHFVGVRPAPVPVPTVGTVNRYWDLNLQPSMAGITTSFAADSITVTAVDGSNVTRIRASDERVDTWKFNHPIDGLRYRAGSTGISNALGMSLGTGTSIAISADPTRHFYSISVARP